MVPMWSRAERFANAYAFAALDGLYTSTTFLPSRLFRVNMFTGLCSSLACSLRLRNGLEC